MKAALDRSGCISCGLCAEACPEVSCTAGDGVAEVYQEDVSESTGAMAVETQKGRPVSVITVD